VSWWFTRVDVLDLSSLAARTVKFCYNPGLAVDTAVSYDSGVTVIGPPVWAWELSTLLLDCTNYNGYGLWWRGRGPPAIARSVETGPS
ncbi:protein BatD, partial [Pseudomonas syringae pv. tagetis]